MSNVQGCSLVGDKITIELVSRTTGQAYRAYAYPFGSSTSAFFFKKKRKTLEFGKSMNNVTFLLEIESYIVLFFHYKKINMYDTHTPAEHM